MASTNRRDFLPDGSIREYNDRTTVEDPIPNGTYVRFIWDTGDHTWYLKRFANLTPINQCDVPNHIQAMCLIID